MKISELSKELGVTSKELIAVANECGIECKAPTKNLSDEETEKVKSTFLKASKAPAKEETKKADEAPEEKAAKPQEEKPKAEKSAERF